MGRATQNNSKAGFLTTFVYDAAGRLLKTIENDQSTTTKQTRTYTYDLLGRVLSEANPESGTTSYIYDSVSGMNCTVTSSGDLVRKTDANGSISCYHYDGLHRNTSITYAGTNSTGVNKYFVFDAATVNLISMTNAEGRMAEAYTCSGSCTAKITDEGFSYDARGQMSDYYQSSSNSGGYYHLSVTRWEDGQIKTVSGVGLPTITYGGLDGEGRVTTVTASAGPNLVSGVTYNDTLTTQPIGALTATTLSTGDTQNFSYETTTGRMTKYSATVGSTPVNISGSLTWNPNGTLKEDNISDGYNAADTQDCTYSYDDFVRVSGVTCINGATTVWAQTFTYNSDAFGNLTKAGSLVWNPGYDPATNHNTLTGTIYDNDGNLKYDSFHTYTWLPDGHVASIDTSTILYDALGNKVEENVGGGILESVSAFGVQTQMTGQTLDGAQVNLPGGVQALYAGATLRRYRFPDWQSSIRAESDTTSRLFTYSVAFAPFGERYILKGAPLNVASFTGSPDEIVRDEYDFLMREEHNGQGRWISPDPTRGVGNKYVYADNDPLSKVDIYGLESVVINGIDYGSASAEFIGNYFENDFAAAESHKQEPRQTGPQPQDSQASSRTEPTQSASNQQAAQANDASQDAQPAAQNTLVAQLEEPEREEERPEEQAERALEPVEAKPETPEPMTPAQEVMSKHSASDIEAVRNGACSVDPKLEEAIRVNDTFNRVKSGGSFPYKQDNTVFQNREGKLPSQAAGYYKEFTISPGSGSGRGTMRLVVGAGGEVYQTNDHYTTFVKIAGP